MATFKFRTRAKSHDIKGKPRVYFTCHPDDLDIYFDKICEDIFKTHDCVIYYTPDMTEMIADGDRETDLGQNNLFVVPVTFKLLSTKNRAMDSDISYAKEKRIPVLPFMMESGIDKIYAQPEKFGERQYLSPFSHDITEVSYKEKLKSYLESVLISDETASRVRAAFDAYVFLSYRKKDRRYANELMKLIHKNTKYRDIAIWYDEFLTPGESFRENIEKAMKNSKLFTLLVTPNLLEEPNGRPNFVMGSEYPLARREGKNVLAVEMESTDQVMLNEKYPDIPESIDPREEALLNENLAKALVDVAKSETDGDLEHNFLIGLAYLDGIDVEIDRQRGIELISSAAQTGLIEAMQKLIDIYSSESDYREELKWRERLYEYYKREYGENDLKTLMFLNNLAMTHSYLGNYKKAREMLAEVFVVRCEILGEEHPATLLAMNNLAVMSGKLGNHQEALALKEEAYALYCKILGEEHHDTLQALNNLAVTCVSLGKYEKAIEYLGKAYLTGCRILGEENPDVLRSLNNLAIVYGKLGYYQKEIELGEELYTLGSKIFGEEHPDTLKFLNNLALSYRNVGDYTKSLEMQTKAYETFCRVLGEDHPESITYLRNLATAYTYLGDCEKALEIFSSVYASCCERLGEKHPDSILSLNDITRAYKELGDVEKALELQEKVYVLSSEVYGEEHFDTLVSLSNLAYMYGETGNYEKAVTLQEKVCELSSAIFGEEHPNTLVAIDNLAYTYNELGDQNNNLRMLENACELRCKLFGEENPDTITAMNDLAFAYYNIKEYGKTLEILERLYKICCEVFGNDDPTTASIKLNLDYVRATIS